jgi:hypothetical protein
MEGSRVIVRMLLVFAVFLGACAKPVERPTDVAAEEAAVRGLWDELGAAFIAQDWDRYSSLWVQGPDLQVIHPGQRSWISGWSEFAPRYRKLVATGGEWAFSTERLEVRVAPTGQTAWLTAEIAMAFSDQTRTAWQMAVCRKVEDKWRIASFFSASLPGH